MISDLQEKISQPSKELDIFTILIGINLLVINLGIIWTFITKKK